MLHVEYRKVEALIPYARNPRTHADAQIAKIAKIAASIVEFGFTNPILVDGENGIIAGRDQNPASRMSNPVAERRKAAASVVGSPRITTLPRRTCGRAGGFTARRLTRYKAWSG
ncbi:MAG: hypothetical protein N2690_13075, partial [Rhodocyclaceae bacterium]|nr:hypothetical protein [Rhodocyclaceae bacterium]